LPAGSGVVGMNPTETQLCDAREVDSLIATIARKLSDARDHGIPFYLVGIRSRGVPLAERLSQELGRIFGEPVDVGAVDITLYRDDLGRADHWPVLRGTEIPFNIDGAEVVLVDDVLFTGRTVRAALNAICDLGRPARVRLAVLVDRGHRELPIQPDAAGLVIATDRGDHVRVRLQPVDPVEEIVRIIPGGGSFPSDRRPAP
jgi:pyrimidine operon attenuation protein/uracil phosphoribosyltransferase